LVTGAGSGIGRSVAAGLSADGYAVALFGRGRERLEETAAGLSGPSMIFVGDVGDAAAVREGFAEIATQLCRLDLLFNNAGTAAFGRPDELTDAQWMMVVNTNLNGAFYCAREAFRMMRTQKPQGGRIINNGSISAHVPRPMSIAYTATKHALTGLTKSLSLDGRPFDIACGQIDIGNADTALTENMKKGILQADGTLRSEPVMDLSAVVACVLTMARLPLDANVQFMTVAATKMPFIGRG
jgi:NAD(P)-dependent dehydrogenase (short-subunit alcohol dehydrogenase family)